MGYWVTPWYNDDSRQLTENPRSWSWVRIPTLPKTIWNLITRFTEKLKKENRMEHNVEYYEVEAQT